MQLSKIKDTLPGTLIVASVLCVVCSLVVSGAAVSLRKVQDKNALLDQQKNILDAAGLAMGEYGVPASKLDKETIDELYSRVSEQVINLRDGSVNDEFPAKEFDLLTVAEDPNYSKSFAELRAENADYDGPEYDPGEERRLDIMKVYFVKDKEGDAITQVVLPIYGKGLWGTLYGYMALKDDFETIQGITFYKHKETPGLGGEVDNPAWKAQWEGIKLYDVDGVPAAMVYKGPAPSGTVFGVDGLSGATITCNGVTNLVRFWASDDGYRAFLERLKSDQSGQSTASVDQKTSQIEGVSS